MLTILLTQTIHLRRGFHRQHLLAVAASVAAVGLLPALLSVPASGWLRLVLLVLFAAFAGRQVLRLVRMQALVQQLRLEELFLRFSRDALDLRRCLLGGEHLWTQSRILHALRTAHTHPPPDHLLAEEKRDRLVRLFQRAFDRWPAGSAWLDLVLVALLLAGLAALRLPFDVGTLVFQSGAVAALVVLVCTIVRLPLHVHTTRLFDAFTQMLAVWAVSDVVVAAGRDDGTRGYAHKLHYRQAPWFVAPPVPRPPRPAPGP